MNIFLIQHPFHTNRELARFEALQRVFALSPHTVHVLRKHILWNVWRRKPHAIHMHRPFSALWVKMARIMSPESTFVLTLSDKDSLPQARLLRLFDKIVAPTRAIQYHLLIERGVRAVYIPDGYMKNIAAPVSLQHFGVTRDRYCVTTANTYQQVKFVASAYAAAKTRKRLIVFVEETGHFKRLKRLYPFLTFVGSLGERPQLSLMREAAAVIISDSTFSSHILLQTMDAARAVVCLVNPLHEEIIGTTGVFYHAGDGDGLSYALRALFADNRLRGRLGKKAQRRVRTHFTWETSAGAYARLYAQPHVRFVSIDSIRPLYRTQKLAV